MGKLPGARYMNQGARMAHKIKPYFRTLPGDVAGEQRVKDRQQLEGHLLRLM